MRVLVADDDPLARRSLEVRLGKWGYDVDAVADGTAAWARIEADDAPRLALLDWSMPGLSGLEICRRLRERADRPYTYVILVTGKSRTENVVEGLDAGADDYIVKPFSSDELRARLRAAQRILELHARVRAEHKAREAARQKHLEEIRRSEERLRAILASLHEMVILVADRDGRILHAWADPALGQRYGLDIPALVGKGIGEFLADDQAARMCERIERVFASNSPERVEERMTCPNGEFWHDTSLCPMRDADGNVRAAVLVLKDITERKNMQDALNQTRRLEAIGHLAAGIAHEINTPLQYTGDNTRFVQESFGDLVGVLQAYGRLLEKLQAGPVDAEAVAEVAEAVEAADVDYLLEEIPQALDQALDGIGRVVKIVRAMKEFSHPQVEEKTACDLNKALQSTITITRNEWKYVADLATDFDDDLPPVVCSPGELNQVFLSLIVNAAGAIAEKLGPNPAERGRIRISTRRDGDLVEVRITDNGCGIPEEIREKVFDPFFTTKTVGSGTGQGLAIARSVVVERHGGTIRFESTPGQGTTFIVRIPIERPAGPGRANVEGTACLVGTPAG